MKKKIFIICSKRFYDKIPSILKGLDNRFEITLPNCYDKPETESEFRNIGKEEHAKWKGEKILLNEKNISNVDAVLVLNFDKDDQKNYIGGATFLEMYDAFRLGKKIYMYNDVPEGILKDEINGFNPIIINGNLDNIFESEDPLL